MRVAVIYRLDRPGGVQSCCFSLIKGLNRQGIIPDVLWDIEPDWALLRSRGILARYKFIRFPISSLFIEKLPYSLRYLAIIANVINGDKFRDQYDFFYIFYNGFLITQNTPHLRYLPGPPLIPQLEQISAGMRGLPYRASNWIYRHILCRISPVYDVHPGNNYVTISEFISELFQEAHGFKIPVIYPPVNLEEQDFFEDDLAKRDTLTFFSRIVDYKRPEMVVDLASHYPNMRCTIMGGVSPHRRPYFESLQTLAERAKLTNVVFIANPSGQRVMEELARTRFYVFPTINEHFGMTTAEAIASGAIPFVHDSGGQREIVIDPRLRFVDADYFDKFDAILNSSISDLNRVRKVLYDHIQIYSEANYIANMLSYLNGCNFTGSSVNLENTVINA